MLRTSLLRTRVGEDVRNPGFRDRPQGRGYPQAKQAVKDGADQLVLTTTTDATLDGYGLVLLEDDKKLQNADNVLPVVNAKDAAPPTSPTPWATSPRSSRPPTSSS